MRFGHPAAQGNGAHTVRPVPHSLARSGALHLHMGPIWCIVGTPIDLWSSWFRTGFPYATLRDGGGGQSVTQIPQAVVCESLSWKSCCSGFLTSAGLQEKKVNSFLDILLLAPLSFRSKIHCLWQFFMLNRSLLLSCLLWLALPKLFSWGSTLGTPSRLPKYHFCWIALSDAWIQVPCSLRLWTLLCCKGFKCSLSSNL